MLGPGDGILAGPDRIRRRIYFPVRLGPEQGEVQGRDLDAPHLMSALGRAGAIGLGEGVAEMPAGGIGMTLDDQNAHGTDVTAPGAA